MWGVPQRLTRKDILILEEVGKATGNLDSGFGLGFGCGHCACGSCKYAYNVEPEFNGNGISSWRDPDSEDRIPAFPFIAPTTGQLQTVKVNFFGGLIEYSPPWGFSYEIFWEGDFQTFQDSVIPPGYFIWGQQNLSGQQPLSQTPYGGEAPGGYLKVDLLFDVSASSVQEGHSYIMAVRAESRFSSVLWSYGIPSPDVPNSFFHNGVYPPPNCSILDYPMAATLTMTPEPSTALLAAVGAMLGLRVRRRA